MSCCQVAQKILQAHIDEDIGDFSDDDTCVAVKPPHLTSAGRLGEGPEAGGDRQQGGECAQVGQGAEAKLYVDGEQCQTRRQEGVGNDIGDGHGAASGGSNLPSLSVSSAGMAESLPDIHLSNKTPGRSFLKEMGTLMQATPMWNSQSKSRKRSRGKGELGKMLERWMEQYKKELTLFRHMLQEAATADAGAVAKGVAATMRFVLAVITEELFDSNLSLCVCRLAANSTRQRYMHVVLSSAVKRAVMNLGFGSVVKFFEPWDMFVLPSCGSPVLMASERCEVLQMLDLEVVPLQQVDALLSQQAVKLPSEIATAIEAQYQADPSHLISELPLVNLNLHDSSQEHADVNIKVKNLDAWMAQVTMRATVLRSFPRGVLVRDLEWQEPSEDSPQPLQWLVRTLRGPDEGFLMPMLFIADESGVVAVKVPEALEEEWLPVLLGGDEGVVEYTFSDLGFGSATGGAELSDSMLVHFSSPSGNTVSVSAVAAHILNNADVWARESVLSRRCITCKANVTACRLSVFACAGYRLPINPAILQVTGRSRFSALAPKVEIPQSATTCKIPRGAIGPCSPRATRLSGMHLNASDLSSVLCLCRELLVGPLYTRQKERAGASLRACIRAQSCMRARRSQPKSPSQPESVAKM